MVFVIHLHFYQFMLFYISKYDAKRKKKILEEYMKKNIKKKDIDISNKIIDRNISKRNKEKIFSNIISLSVFILGIVLILFFVVFNIFSNN